MKCLFFIFALISSTIARSVEHTNCICPALWSPVCGADGQTTKTYGNRCLFRCAQKDNPDLTLFSDGPCADPIDDPLYDAPEAPKAEDNSKCFCSMDYHPVCATDGLTYGNICHLNCARRTNPSLGIAFHGICKGNRPGASQVDPTPYKQDCLCTREYRPVCETTKNVTYPNVCAFNCALKSDPSLKIGSQGPC